MLVLVCGLPRTGKTTLSETFGESFDVVHLDDFAETNNAYLYCIEEASKHDNVVVDGLFHRVEQRKNLVNAYSGEEKKCIWLDPPKEVKKDRVGYGVHSEFLFSPPSYEEGWDEIEIIR